MRINESGVTADKDRIKYTLGFCKLSDWTLVVKIKEKAINISIIVVYVPAVQSPEEGIKKISDTRNK